MPRFRDSTALPTNPHFIEGGGEHHPENRLAIHDQSNIDGKFAIALDELLGTIQGIDQPKRPLPDIGNMPRRYAFLGHHGDVGRGER